MRRLLILLPLLGIIACGAQMQQMNFDYEGRDYSAKILAICPIPENAIKVGNPKELADNFKGDPRKAAKVIQDSLYKLFINAALKKATNCRVLRKRFTPAEFNDMYDSKNSTTETLTIGAKGPTYNFRVPTVQCLEEKGVPRDFVLFINKLIFVRQRAGEEIQSGVPGPSSGTMMGGGGAPPDLASETEYILWDYSLNKVVSFGKIKVETPIAKDITDKNWHSNINTMIMKLFDKTPFKFMDLIY